MDSPNEVLPMRGLQTQLEAAAAHGNAIPHGHYAQCDSVVAVQLVVQLAQCNDLLIHVLQTHFRAKTQNAWLRL